MIQRDALKFSLKKTVDNGCAFFHFRANTYVEESYTDQTSAE